MSKTARTLLQYATIMRTQILCAWREDAPHVCRNLAADLIAGTY